MWRARDVLGRNVKLMRKSPLQSHQTQLEARNFSFGTIQPNLSLPLDMYVSTFPHLRYINVAAAAPARNQAMYL